MLSSCTQFWGNVGALIGGGIGYTTGRIIFTDFTYNGEEVAKEIRHLGRGFATLSLAYATGELAKALSEYHFADEESCSFNEILIGTNAVALTFFLTRRMMASTLQEDARKRQAANHLQ